MVPVAAAFLAVAVCLVTMAFAAPPASAAADTVILQGQAKTQVDSLRDQAAAVQADIDSLDQQIERLDESYNQLSLQVDNINQKMSDLRRQLDAAQADRDYRVRMVDDRLVAIYKAISSVASGSLPRWRSKTTGLSTTRMRALARST